MLTSDWIPKKESELAFKMFFFFPENYEYQITQFE